MLFCFIPFNFFSGFFCYLLKQPFIGLRLLRHFFQLPVILYLTAETFFLFNKTDLFFAELSGLEYVIKNILFTD